MRQTRAAALLWAYDIGSKFGIAWRPRTILLMLGMVAVLGLVPTLALALWVGRLLNTIEVFVSNLRRKLEEGGEPRLLQTVRGVGYALREEP